MAIFLPNSPIERKRITQSNLILENPSRSFGVGLLRSDGIVHVECNNILQGDQRTSPLVLDLAKHMGLIRENVMSTNMVIFKAVSISGSTDGKKSLGRKPQKEKSWNT